VKRSSKVRLPLVVERLVPGGAGLAFAENEGERRAVFVRRAAPGDRVEADVDFSRRPAEVAGVTWIERGAGHIDAPCPYVGRCGGCDWMHLSFEAQREAHERFLTEALPEAWREIRVMSHVPPKPLGYRTRARLHARASGGRAIVGMHEEKSHEPVEVDACIALDERLELARGEVAALLEGAHGRGDAQLALGALTPEPRRVVLELRWNGRVPADVYGRIERAAAGPLWQGARLWVGEATRPSVIGNPTPHLRGYDGEPLRLAPGGFAQASEEGNALLVGRVATLAAEVAHDKSVLELYAGAGNFTVALARASHPLVAVESSREACEAARANLHARGLKAKVVEADAATYTTSTTPHLLVLDPPRTGAKEVAAKLAARPAKFVLYVSCDPRTLARDLAILEPRYDVRAVEMFEMFPQTSHVESVVLLEKRRS
jgi:23S rRNA (uracil1939-C5)-methyltransferase